LIPSPQTTSSESDFAAELLFLDRARDISSWALRFCGWAATNYAAPS
jgi:hypothetical protein